MSSENKTSSKLTAIDLKKATSAQIDNYILECEEHNNKMEVLFDNQRHKIGEELTPLFAILGSKNYKDFIELQASSLALRQTIQEQIIYYMQKLSKANANFKVANGNRQEYYSTGYGLKITDGLKNKLVDRDLSERERTIELFQSHIEYLRECRYSCDQIQFAVKNMVGLVSYISVLEN